MDQLQIIGLKQLISLKSSSISEKAMADEWTTKIVDIQLFQLASSGEYLNIFLVKNLSKLDL